MPIKFTVMLLFLQTIVWGSEHYNQNISPFLEQYCLDCHDDETSKGDLDISSLDYNLDDSHLLKKWEYIYARVKSGEMPPKKKKRPESGQLASFLNNLYTSVYEADYKIVKT